MSERSGFQRFVSELRRRHVPQTAAIYLVAAWAAIEFSDVAAPNLNWPEWVVPAVIIAAGVGLPVVLILAWFFDWTVEGVHRTEGATAGTPGRGAGSPWLAVMAVLVVGIGSALGVAALLAGEQDDARRVEGDAEREEGEAPEAPPVPPVLGSPGSVVDPDSIRESVQSRLGDLERIGQLGQLGQFGRWEALEGLASVPEMDSTQLSQLVELVREIAERSDVKALIRRPEQWRAGQDVPVDLAEGDTLVVEGVATDSAGVVSVQVDGRTVAESDEPDRAMTFRTTLTGTGSGGIRRVHVVVRTADGRAVRSVHRILQLPGGTP